MLLGLDSPLKQGIFVIYVLLWVSCHLLVYRSKQADAPAYNATSVVLLTELVKLIMAGGLYLSKDGGPDVLMRSTSASLPLMAKYTIPALLYCVYNNLVYINLTFFDPGTYNVLMQLRIMITGVLYQVRATPSRAPAAQRFATLRASRFADPLLEAPQSQPVARDRADRRRLHVQ